MITAGTSASGTGTGVGNVVSFSAGNLSPLFTTSVANPTTNPALSFAAVNQNKNLFYSGPSTGAAALPSFRTLNKEDLDSPPGVNTIDWVQRMLLDTTGNSSINWRFRVLFDSASVYSIDWNNRNLIDSGNVISLDYTNRIAIDPLNVNSIDWNNRSLIDSSGVQSVDWNAKFLIDSIGNSSIDWDNRNLIGTDGTSIPFTWDNTNVTIKTGAMLINEDNTTAPALVGSPPVFIDYYGGNTNALGDPNDWIPVTLNGVVGKIPFYIP
jgi:hypothetical protein